MTLEFTKMILGIALITGFWLAIDLWWQRMFGSEGRRTGCHGCHCSTPCSKATQTDTNHTDDQGEH